MTPSRLFCDACGAANRPQAQFCVVCGQSLPDMSAMQASSQELVPGTLLKQRYRILAQVGAGGFGAVYRAADTELGDRVVAVKEMSQKGLGPREALEAIGAFKQEALMLAALTHPNLPRIYEHFLESGHWYLVMDFIEGETLEEYLSKQGKLPIAEVLAIGIQLCTVLDYLHTRQPPIIFRDLKPSNVMRSSGDHLSLIDFGIARHFKQGQARDTVAFGSPGYAAPEQYGKAQTTPRSDIYSLGATLHHLLTGQDPSQTPFRFAPPHLSVPGVPLALDRLIMQMVEIDEEKRPASAALVRQELQRIASELASGRAVIAPALPPASQPRKSRQTLSAPAPPIGTMQSEYAGHVGRVRTLAWSPDGKLIVSAGDDYSVQVWNAGNGESAFTCRGHSGPVRSVAWSPDARYIASAGEDRKVLIWDVKAKRLLLTYRGHTHHVDSVSWSPDSQSIASASIDKTVQIWNAATGRCRLTYRGHSEVVYTVAWSPNGQYIASSGYDGTVQVWNPLTGIRVYTYRDNAALAYTLAWSPDSQSIASAGEEVHIWQPGIEGNTSIYRGHTDLVQSLAWSPDGTRIASVSDRVHVWNAATGEKLYTHPGRNTVAWSPNGTRIASGSNTGTVEVWAAE